MLSLVLLKSKKKLKMTFPNKIKCYRETVCMSLKKSRRKFISIRCIYNIKLVLLSRATCRSTFYHKYILVLVHKVMDEENFQSKKPVGEVYYSMKREHKARGGNPAIVQDLENLILFILMMFAALHRVIFM